jgi:hypothetical protein
MRKMNLIWLALFATLAFSALVASPALAVEHEWLDNSGMIPLGTTIAGSGSSTTVLQVDFNAGIHTECSYGWSEIFGADGTRTITQWNTLVCTFFKKGECLETSEGGELKVEAKHLPWLDTLELVEYLGSPTLVDMITSDGAGNPGWLTECTVLVLGNPTKADDTCEAALIYGLTNNEIEGQVDIEFMEDLGPFTNCDVTTGGVLVLSGTEVGKIEGLGLLSAVDKTLALAAN